MGKKKKPKVPDLPEDELKKLAKDIALDRV